MANFFKKDEKTLDATTKAVNKLLKSADEERSEKVEEKKVEHHRHHYETPVFNEAIKKDLEKRMKAKQEVKQAQKAKKKSFTSFVSKISRRIGVNEVQEDREDLTLLCDQMHFDAKEAYKLLRTNILFCLPDNDVCRTIGITSPIRGEGKSTVAINLAYTLAVTKVNVLLIDMDMRLPSIASKLNIEKTLGLSDYLVGNATLKNVIRSTDKYPNWDIMLSGSIPPTPSELISSESMQRLIKGLERKYDFIIIDLPPVNVVSDALVAKDILDGYILTVRQDYSDRHSLADCIRQLGFLDANVLGFVMTDSDGGAHYAKKYGKKYGKYYRKYYRRRYGYYKKYGYGYNNNYGYGYGYGYNNPKQEQEKK